MTEWEGEGEGRADIVRFILANYSNNRSNFQSMYIYEIYVYFGHVDDFKSAWIKLDLAKLSGLIAAKRELDFLLNNKKAVHVEWTLICHVVAYFN